MRPTASQSANAVSQEAGGQAAAGSQAAEDSQAAGRRRASPRPVKAPWHGR